MSVDYVIMPRPEGDENCRWMRISDGRIVRRGRGTDWLPPLDDDDEGEETGRVLLVVPPAETTLHWIACPGMTARQGAAAARLVAIEASIGEGGALHAAATEDEDGETPHLVAVASRTAMDFWMDWCARHGVPQASFVPAAALLPPPADEGVVIGSFGGSAVVRGADFAVDGQEPFAELLVADRRISELTAEAADTVLLNALSLPPLDLRQGDYARRPPALFSPTRLRRLGALLGGILFVTLMVSLVTVIRLNAEARRLDRQTVDLARTVVPSVETAEDADDKLAALLAQRGGAGGFTGTMAGLMTAMQASPAVTLTGVNQLADGSLRVQLSATKADDINAVLLSIQDAGWRISANSVQQQGARLVADIKVVRP